MQTKRCPRCGCPARLDAVECVKCHHAFRMKWSVGPAVDDLPAAPPPPKVVDVHLSVKWNGFTLPGIRGFRLSRVQRLGLLFGAGLVLVVIARVVLGTAFLPTVRPGPDPSQHRVVRPPPAS